MLKTAGFKNVASIAGGIKAWQGQVAAGTPEAGMSFFTVAADAGELIALAWVLEDGSRRFYASLAESSKGSPASILFGSLVSAEEHHKAALLALFRETTGREPDPDFPKGLSAAEDGQDRMEGNVKVSDALAWAKGKSVQDLLELSMSLETDSYDLYIKMGRTVEGEQARKVFKQLAGEEQEHLKKMAELLDKGIGLGVQGV